MQVGTRVPVYEAEHEGVFVKGERVFLLERKRRVSQSATHSETIPIQEGARGRRGQFFPCLNHSSKCWCWS